MAPTIWSALLEEELTVDLSLALQVVESRAALVEARVASNELWLTLGFLSDQEFSPEAYVMRAECQRELRRELAEMTDFLAGAPGPDLVA
jgi:hypothetical protein